MTRDGIGKSLLDGPRPYLWIAAAVFALYFKSLFFDYTHLDDNILILGNEPFLRDAGSLAQAFFQKVFARSFLPYYRPMLVVSLILDTFIGGGVGPLVYHLTNVAIHAAASCLVMLFLARLGYDRLRSFLLGLIFAVHPVLSQGVAWIPGRNDTLLMVFVLGSFIFLLDMLRTARGSSYICHLALFLLALFTKETALVLAAVAAIYVFFVAKQRVRSVNFMALAVGWAASILIWHQFRRAVTQGSVEISPYDMAHLLAQYIPAAVQFAGKIFFPLNLSVFPILRDTTYLYGAAAIAIVALALIFTKQRRYPMIIFGLAWAVGFLLPSLIRANSRISADFLEHRVYVPMAGIFIILLETDLVKKARAAYLAAAASVIVALFAAATFFHIDNFRDRFAFWRNAARTSPHSSFAHLAMALAYHDSGALDPAEAEYRRCLELDPGEPGAFYGLGKIFLKRGMSAEAERELRKTIAVYPVYANAYIELGALYYKEGRLPEAEWAWGRAFEIEPKNPVTNKFLAIYYFERKDPARAAKHARILRDMGARVPADFLKAVGIVEGAGEAGAAAREGG